MKGTLIKESDGRELYVVKVEGEVQLLGHSYGFRCCAKDEDILHPYDDWMIITSGIEESGTDLPPEANAAILDFLSERRTKHES